MRRSARFKPVPAAVIRRMAQYHCLLTDWLLGGKNDWVTSKGLAKALGVTEVTVRSDLSYLGTEPGVRGVGYRIFKLKQLLDGFLGLPSHVPIAFVGSLRTMDVFSDFFAIERFGFSPTAFFSENPNDLDAIINGHEVRSITKIPSAVADMGIKVAIVATRPTWVQHTVNLLAEGGIRSILILTPAAEIKVPDNVNISQVGVPCELKTLAYHAGLDKDNKQLPYEREVASFAQPQKEALAQSASSSR